jgi:hypothetical protein
MKRCMDVQGVSDLPSQSSMNLCPGNITKSLPSTLENDSNLTAMPLSLVMMSCEEAASFGWVPVGDFCFTGNKTSWMSDEEFKVLSDFWAQRDMTYVILQMEQQQVILTENNITQTTQYPMLYSGPFFLEDSHNTDLNMEKTQIHEFSSFWLGQLGNEIEESFYRTESRIQHSLPFNGISIWFTLSLNERLDASNQRLMTFTRYSVIDVL